MFSSATYQQRVQFRREDKAILALILLLAPAALVATAGVIACVIKTAADVMGLPGGDLAASFLHDTFGLTIFTLLYVVAIITVPAIVCALSDPVSSRLAIRPFKDFVFGFLPPVVQFLETLGGHPTAQPLLATPGGVRPVIRPQPSLPALRFSPGDSPQLE